MSVYTNESQIESVLQRDLTAKELEVIDDVIVAVGNAINTYTGRRWIDIEMDVDDVEAEIRLYDGDGSRELFIDDFCEIEQIRLCQDNFGYYNEVLVEDNYTTYPLNTQWKNSIKMLSGRFPRRSAGVEVTAKFYTGEVPPEVQLASASLTGLFLSKARNTSDFKKESIEGYSYEVLTGTEATEQEKATLDRLDFWRKVEI